MANGIMWTGNHIEVKPPGEERWKVIPGFEGRYEVSTFGRVATLPRHYGVGIIRERKILRQMHVRGYRHVTLWKNGVPYQKQVHRLVAEVFIPNPESKPCINHLDEDGSHNFVGNLEWCTYRENSNWGSRNSRIAKKKCRPIKQFDKEGNFIRVWGSLAEAATGVGVNDSSLCESIRLPNRTCAGFVWRYADE